MNYPTESNSASAGVPLGLQSSGDATIKTGIDSTNLSSDLASSGIPNFASNIPGATVTNSGTPASQVSGHAGASSNLGAGSTGGASTGGSSEFSQQAAERAGNIAQQAQDTFTNVQQNLTSAANATVNPKDSGSMNDGEAHVAGLAGGIGGAIASAPLAALEKISPVLAGHASNAASIAQTHAQNAANSISARLPDLSDPNNTNSDAVKEKAGQLGQTAQNYLGQAVEAAKGYLPESLGGGSTATGGSGGLTDSGRQDATDKLGAAVKPDSEKTYTEATTDTIKGNPDKAASYVQPDSNKSLGQQATDSFTS